MRTLSRAGATALTVSAAALALLPLAAPRSVSDVAEAASPLASGWDAQSDSPVRYGVALQPMTQTMTQTTPPDAQHGLELFAEHCAACHGPVGDGDGRLADRLPSPPPPLRGSPSAATSSLRQTYDAITDGRLDRMMPPFADSLTDEERWSLAAAVQTLRTGPERLVRGRRAFDENCAGCHDGSLESGPALRTVEGSWSDAARRHAADWSSAGLFELVRGQGDHPNVGLDDTDEALLSVLDYVRNAAFDPIQTDGLTTDGEVTGRVVLVPDRSGVAGLAVGATSYAMGMPGTVVTATTDSEGRFVHGGQLAGPGVNTLLQTQYAGVTYSEVVTPAVGVADHGGETHDIVVFETTGSAPLVAERAHILLSPAPESGVIRAVEIWTIRNPLDRTLIAESDGSTLRFLLPPDAVGARFGAGSPQLASQVGDLASSLDAVELTTRSPVLPGAQEVSFEYEVPYEGSSLDWPVRTTLSTDELNLAIVAEGVTMSHGNAESRSGDIGGQPVSGLSLGALGAGESREVSIAGLARPMAAPSAVAVAGRRPPAWPALLAALGAVVGFIVAATFPVWGTHRADRRRERELEARRSALVDRLAQVDADLAGGRLDGAEHRSRRSTLMATAVNTDILLAQVRADRADGLEEGRHLAHDSHQSEEKS